MFSACSFDYQKLHNTEFVEKNIIHMFIHFRCLHLEKLCFLLKPSPVGLAVAALHSYFVYFLYSSWVFIIYIYDIDIY